MEKGKDTHSSILVYIPPTPTKYLKQGVVAVYLPIGMPVQVSLFAGGLGFTEGFLCVGTCCVLANAQLHTCTVSVSYGVFGCTNTLDRKSTRLNSSHTLASRMPSSA